jgi:hypothetical protein
MSFLLGLAIGIFLGGTGGVILAAMLAGAARSEAQRPKPDPASHLPDSSGSSGAGSGP